VPPQRNDAAPVLWNRIQASKAYESSGTMDDFQTWRDLNSKAVPEGAEDAELYWPFGFPHDFLIYCRYFSDTLLRKHFPWRRLIALPSFIFNTCAPLYATPEPAAEEAPCVSDQSASDEPDFAAPQKRVSFPTARLAAARSTVRHLFSGPPPAKRAKAETQRPPIELYHPIHSQLHRWLTEFDQLVQVPPS
jgi:hypothetical protein